MMHKVILSSVDRPSLMYWKPAKEIDGDPWAEESVTVTFWTAKGVHFSVYSDGSTVYRLTHFAAQDVDFSSHVLCYVNNGSRWLMRGNGRNATRLLFLSD